MSNELHPENRNIDSSEQTIPVIQEYPVIGKEIIETGKVSIHKSVIEEVVSVDLPILNEFYEINHLEGSDEILDNPPPVQNDGNITVIPVIKEITVVQKKYVVTRRLQIVKKITETPLSQEITLRREVVDVTRK